MNRILFERDEIHDGVVRFGGVRAEHVIGILHAEKGDVLKTGEVDGPIGTGRVVAVDSAARTVEMELDHRAESLRPWVDIVLAPPRPRVMKRLLPQLAALGVGRIVLVGAKKVEKDFWGATLLKDENMRPLLVEGLMQSGTSILPVVDLRRNFRKFLLEEADAMFPGSCRVAAHPGEGMEAVGPCAGRPLLAIGPEGGWTDGEVELMVKCCFALRSLGPRILKTETAAIALISRLYPVAHGGSIR
ncbi:MAG: 16S rRNA (uracil(1498)-N(3))-methyltransferase [Kiritimatiellae bacterium]|nr:16S rRNA (uracil(1498)-N(3))-methyltransferase [Kiritimatiellia bacterium]